MEEWENKICGGCKGGKGLCSKASQQHKAALLLQQCGRDHVKKKVFRVHRFREK